MLVIISVSRLDYHRIEIGVDRFGTGFRNRHIDGRDRAVELVELVLGIGNVNRIGCPSATHTEMLSPRGIPPNVGMFHIADERV